MNPVLQTIEKIGIIPVIKIDDADKAVPLALALKAGGIPCAEITFRTEQAVEAIRRIAAEVPDILLGAGTVLTAAQADSAISAGVKFIVSPGFNPKIVAHCLEKGVTVIPGCSIPSDIEQALEFGLEVVKFFPAEQAGGLEYIKAVAAPYPSVKFIPTGGINAGNIKKYLAFDRVIACGGSWMVSADMISGGRFDEITNLCKETVQIIRGAEPCRADGKSENIIDSKRVVTFGEIMLRLASEGYARFVQADAFIASCGGGEANVAVSLANFGLDAAFITKLPKHELGQCAVNKLREFGVDTSGIVRGGSRIGIYFLEKGASQRPSKVIYDRAGSSVAEAERTDFDWERVFENADWFHFTGITPALGDNVAEICLEACKTAKAKGITVSCDLNYRKNLWTREKAGRVMAGLMKYVDICISNEEDAADVFGIHAENTEVTAGKVSHEGYMGVAERLVERFGFKRVAITLRESISASDNNWAGMLYDGGEFYFSPKYPVHIVDRVGGGDSFGAGLIYASLNGFSPQKIVEFAAAASCLKHSVEGDFNHVSVDEVKKLIGGDGSGRVQR